MVFLPEKNLTFKSAERVCTLLTKGNPTGNDVYYDILDIVPGRTPLSQQRAHPFCDFEGRIFYENPPPPPKKSRCPDILPIFPM